MAVQDLTDQIRREKVAERYPPLFKRLPDRLFTPLASASRFQYWSLLCVLHAKRFGPEAPLPPRTGFLMREITADIAEELQYQDGAPDGDEVAPATPLVTNRHIGATHDRRNGATERAVKRRREVVILPFLWHGFGGRRSQFWRAVGLAVRDQA